MLKTSLPLLKRSSQTGFALIEVLVSILILSIGLLGAAGLFTRGIDFTIDTERRQMAAMLANELMETMRGDTSTILTAKGWPKDDLGGYAKAVGAELDSASCDSESVDPSNQLNCWAARSRRLMPDVTDEFIAANFSVTQQSGVIAIQVAWPSKSEQCLAADKDENEKEYCTYTIQSKL